MKRLVLLVIFLVLVAAAGSGFFYLRTREAYRGFGGAEQFVDIPPGASTRTIGDRLVAAGIVRDRVTFRLALWMSGRGRLLKAGEYRFEQPMTPFDVVGKLARGEVYVIRVTFPEGLTIREMAAIFETHGLGTAAEFVKAAKDVSLVRALDPVAKNLGKIPSMRPAPAG